MSDQPTAAVGDTPVISPYRSSARRASVAVVLLAASTVIAAMQLILSGVFLAFAEGLEVASVPEAGIAFVVTFTTAIQVLALGVSLATVVAYLAWLSRAVDNVPALGGGRPAASPTWAIAWWFIPFANLGMPYEVVRDLRARVRGNHELSHPPLLVAWWFTFILGQVGTVAVLQAPTENSAQVGAALAVAMGAYALTACAGILAILVVRDIEAASRARAARVQAGEPMVSGLASDAETMAKGQTGWRMRPSWVGFLAVTGALVLPVALVAWVGSASASAAGSSSSSVSPTASHSQPPASVSTGKSGGAVATSNPSSCVPGAVPGGALPHGAPELEATPPHDGRWAAPRSLVDVGLVLDRHGLHHGRRGG